MRKLIATLLLLVPGFQIYAQHVNFTQKVFSCDYSEADKVYWPLINNSGFNFSIEKGHYLIECLDPAKKAYAPLKWEQRPEVFKVETNVHMEPGSEGSIGLVYCAQNKLESGYILQIDKNKRYRICIIQANNLKPLTGDRTNDGWLEFKKLNKAGVNNKIDLQQEDGRISILLNDAPVVTYHNKLKSLSGEFGFLLMGRSKAIAEDFNIYGVGAAPVDSITIKATEAQLQAKKDSAIAAMNAIPVPKADTTAVVVNKPQLFKTDNKKAAPDKKQSKASKEKEKKALAKKETKPALKPIGKDTVPALVASKVEATQAPAAIAIVKDSVPPKVNLVKKEDKKDTKKGAKKKEEAKTAVVKVPAEQNNAQLQPAQTKDSTSKDLTTLSIAVGEYRKENLKLKTDNENLSAELKQIKLKNEDLQAFINKNLDIKLKTDLEQAKNKNEILTKENETLKEENSDLKGLKENISKAKDGDIIILLSDNLKKEQKKNEELTKKVKELDDKLKAKPAIVKPAAKAPLKPAETKPAQEQKTEPKLPTAPAKAPEKTK